MYTEAVNFQEGTPLRADISAIGLGGCFRLYHVYQRYNNNNIKCGQKAVLSFQYGKFLMVACYTYFSN